MQCPVSAAEARAWLLDLRSLRLCASLPDARPTDHDCEPYATYCSQYSSNLPPVAQGVSTNSMDWDYRTHLEQDNSVVDQTLFAEFCLRFLDLQRFAVRYQAVTPVHDVQNPLDCGHSLITDTE